LHRNSKFWVDRSFDFSVIASIACHFIRSELAGSADKFKLIYYVSFNFDIFTAITIFRCVIAVRLHGPMKGAEEATVITVVSALFGTEENQFVGVSLKYWEVQLLTGLPVWESHADTVELQVVNKPGCSKDDERLFVVPASYK